MSIRSKALLALCACTVTLAVGAASAAAGVERYMLMHGGEITATSVEAVSFAAGEISVRCSVTMQGSLRTSIGARSGESMGSITRTPTGRCEEGTALTFLGVPWAVTYSSFTGTQPEAMTAFLTTMAGVSASVRFFGGLITCLYRGNVGLSLALRGRSPYEIGNLTTLPNSLSLVSGEGCPSTGSMRGTFRLASADLLIEVQILPLMASPSVLSRATSQTGVPVTFRPSTANVTVNGGLWRDGANGWTTDITPCLRTITYPGGSCQITITATATAGANQIRLTEAGGIAGVVNVGP